MVLFFDVDFSCVIRSLFDDKRFVADALKTEEKKVLAFSLGTFRLWFCRSRCFWKSSKVNKFGTFLKVKYLILLNIISVFPTHVGFSQKSKNFSLLLASRKCLLYKCFQRTDICRFSFNRCEREIPRGFSP